MLAYPPLSISFKMYVQSSFRERSLFVGGGRMGEKMGGPKILATAKRGVLGKFFVIGGS